MEALLIHYLGNQRASLILIIQTALPCVPHTVSHTSRKRLECVSNAFRMRTITETRPICNNLKPANLLVFQEARQDSGDGWTVKLTDFGGAVLDVENHGVGTLRTPTPPWNAPEWPEHLDAKGLLGTDVYSLGLAFADIFCHCSNFFNLISFEPHSRN